MADIQQYNLIKLADLVNAFNEKVWVALSQQVGTMYARNAATLTKDT